MPFAGVNGQRLYYEVGGDGDMVVLLHGAFADADIMEAPATGLASGFRAMRFDRRGHGRSSPWDLPVSLQDEAADVKALIDWFSVEKAHFLAHDQGAEVAIEFALTHPDRTGSIGLLAPSLEGYRWSEDYLKRQHELVTALRMDAKAGIQEKWLTSPAFDAMKEREGMLDRVAAIFMRYSGGSVRHDPPPHAGPTQAQRLGEITARTAVFIGDREEADRILCARTIAMTVPGAEFVTFPNTGRFLHVEESRAVMRRLTDFFLPEPEIER